MKILFILVSFLVVIGSAYAGDVASAKVKRTPATTGQITCGNESDPNNVPMDTVQGDLNTTCDSSKPFSISVTRTQTGFNTVYYCCVSK